MTSIIQGGQPPFKYAGGGVIVREFFQVFNDALSKRGARFSMPSFLMWLSGKQAVYDSMRAFILPISLSPAESGHILHGGISFVDG
jgi:hypothetical protein